MSLNEVGSVIIESGIRQFVLFGKANVSHDCGRQVGLNLWVAKTQTATAYKDAFVLRTRWAREASGLKQDEIATLLQLDQPTYSKYEKRSMLPHRYMEPFCLACRVDLTWLIAEKGRGPLTGRPEPKPTRPRTPPSKRSKKAA